MPRQKAQELVDLLAAGITGYTQGRHDKREFESNQANRRFQQEIAVRQDTRAESAARRDAEKWTLDMMKGFYDLAEAKSDREKREKFEAQLQIMAPTISQRLGVSDDEAREIITEQGIKLLQDMEEGTARIESSRASAAHSRSLIEGSNLRNQKLQRELESLGIVQGLDAMKGLYGSGLQVTPEVAERLTGGMVKAGELTVRGPRGATTDPVKAKRTLMLDAQKIARDKGGTDQDANHFAERTMNDYLADVFVRSGGNLLEFQPLAFDPHDRNLNKQLEAIDKFYSNNALSGQTIKPGFENLDTVLQSQRELIGAKVVQDLNAMLGIGQATDNGASGNTGLPTNPMGDAPEHVLGAVVEAQTDGIDLMPRILEHRQNTGQWPTVDEVVTIYDEETQKKSSAEPEDKNSWSYLLRTFRDIPRRLLTGEGPDYGPLD